MATIPGADQQILGKFFDLGGMVHNVRHENYGAVGDGVTDDTTAIRAAIIGAEGATIFFPPGIYAVMGDIELPANLTVQAEGATIKWMGGVAPTDAVVICQDAAATEQVENLRIKGLNIDANGQPVAAMFYGLGPSCKIDISVENFTLKGVVVDKLGAVECEGFNLDVIAKARSGAESALEVGYSSKAFVSVIATLVEGQLSTMLRGVHLTGDVAQCVFQKVLIEDADIPLDIGDEGGCVNNTFIGVDASNPTDGPGDIVVGAFTGTVLFLVRDHATPNNFHSIIGVRDGTGFDRLVFDDENDTIIPGGLDVAYPVVFGTSGSVAMANLQVASITFEDNSIQVSAGATSPDAVSMLA